MLSSTTATARWYANDRLGNWPEQIDKSPYAYAWNNPVNLKNPDGNCPVCIIAAIGGAINVATHWNKIMSGGHPLRDGFAAFGIGAVAGTVAAVTGGGALLAEGGAALTSLAAIENAAAIGAYASASSSLVQGVGNAAYFNDPYSPADFASAAVLGGVTGGIAKGVQLAIEGGVPVVNARVIAEKPVVTTFGNDEVPIDDVSDFQIGQKNLTLNVAKQSNHYGATTISGRSYLTTDPQNLLNDLNNGSFQAAGTNFRGMNIVKFIYNIGVVVAEKTGENIGTTAFGVVHINSSGSVHIVPYLFK